MEQTSHLDIVELIECNPITRLSDESNERMIQKVKEHFTETQQQMFIASFFCYLNYDQKTAFVVDLDNVWNWMGFSHKHKAKDLLIKEFQRDKDYKILLNFKVEQKNTDTSPSNSSDEEEKKETRGGHNKQTIMMTIRTFKLFCLKAGTRKAGEVQEYYMKMEELLHDVLQEECVELKNKLQKAKLENENVQYKAAKMTHNKILNCYLNKNVVYLCKLRDHDDKMIVKIGSSQNLKERLANIKNKYNVDPLLLYVLECKDHVKFERSLHNNETIRGLYINMNTIEGFSQCSRETYLVSQEHCENIIEHIQSLYKNFESELEIEALKIRLELTNKELELEKLRIQREEAVFRREELVIQRLKLEEEKAKRLELEVDKYQNEMCDSTPIITTAVPVLMPAATSGGAQQIRLRKNTRSPIVYKFNPDTGAVIEKYDSIIDAIRANEGTSATPLKTAAKENKIYHGYRWVFTDRDDVNEPFMPDTVESSTYTIDYVAMIDIKREKIMEVFPSQRDAALSRNLKGFTTISRAIKNQTISSGHYWNLFANCSNEMKEEYLRTHTLPERYVRPNNTIVEKINPITNEVTDKYNSLSDATKNNQMSRATLKKVAERN